MIRRYYFYLYWLIIFLPYSSAQADLFDFSEKNQPVSIEADNGVEIHQQEKTYIARGNVKIIRGNLQLKSDTVTAYYRDKKQGKGIEIWKVLAQGTVEISSEADLITASEAILDFDQSSFVLQSQPSQAILIKWGDNVLTAQDKVEYVNETHRVTAWGKPTLSNKPMDMALAADEIQIFLPSLQGQSSGKTMRIQKLTADHQVRLQLKDTVAFSDQLVYTVQEKNILMSGHAQITQGNNQIQGDNVLINLATKSVSVTNNPGSSQRVNTLLLLDQTNK